MSWQAERLSAPEFGQARCPTSSKVPAVGAGRVYVLPSPGSVNLGGVRVVDDLQVRSKFLGPGSQKQVLATKTLENTYVHMYTHT